MKKIYKIILLAMVIATIFPVKVLAAGSSLHDLSPGTIITFSGKQWEILEQETDGTTYVILNNNDGNRAFDPNNTQIFNPLDSNNIGYYLNNTFYNSLTQKDLIVSHSWDIKFQDGTGSQSNVSANIGLLSYSEYSTLRSLFPSSGTGYWWWLRTPYSSYSPGVWFVNTSGSLNISSASSAGGVRPALYLKSGILVSSTNEVQGVGSAPSAPVGLSASDISANQVKLTWQANNETDLAGYVIYRDGNQIDSVGADVINYTDINVSPGTQYTYGIEAYNTSNIYSGMSNTVIVSTPSAPQAPTGLSSGNINDSAFTLYWLKQDDATSYNVYLDGTLAGNVSQPLIYNPSLDIGNLIGGSTYLVTVTAVNQWGESTASQPLSVTLLPSAPTGLQIKNVTTNSLDLSWSGSNGATSYTIFQNGNPIATTTENPYHITNLDPSLNYSFQIAAVNNAGQSTLSNPIDITTNGTPPQIPIGLSADNITDTSFTLYWLKQDDATSYNVYLDGSLVGNISQPLIYNPSLDISKLAGGTTYSVTVTAVNQWGESTASQPLSVTTIVPVPILSAKVDGESINLAWKNSVGNSFSILVNNKQVAQVTASPYSLTEKPGTYQIQVVQNFNGQQYPSNILTIKISALQTVGPAQMTSDVLSNTGAIMVPAGGLLALALALKGSPMLIAAAKALFLKS